MELVTCCTIETNSFFFFLRFTLACMYCIVNNHLSFFTLHHLYVRFKKQILLRFLNYVNRNFSPVFLKVSSVSEMPASSNNQPGDSVCLPAGLPLLMHEYLNLINAIISIALIYLLTNN
jgi:hypothetical protein